MTHVPCSSPLPQCIFFVLPVSHCCFIIAFCKLSCTLSTPSSPSPTLSCFFFFILFLDQDHSMDEMTAVVKIEKGVGGNNGGNGNGGGAFSQARSSSTGSSSSSGGGGGGQVSDSRNWGRGGVERMVVNTRRKLAYSSQKSFRRGLHFIDGEASAETQGT